MNILFIKDFCVGFMVSEIPRGPYLSILNIYSGTVRIRLIPLLS